MWVPLDSLNLDRRQETRNGTTETREKLRRRTGVNFWEGAKERRAWEDRLADTALQLANLTFRVRTSRPDTEGVDREI
jgi:hypothetical protein